MTCVLIVATMRHRPLLAIVALAQLMVVLDFSIVNVALPRLSADLGLATGAAQWIITGYAVALGGALLLAGRAADLFGRRRMFAAGLAVFALASLGGGLAPSASMVVAARIVQGLGAAMLSPAALSLLTTTFEGADRDRALGLFGAVSAAGFAVGVVLGGVLTEWLGWRSVFFINVPLALVALAFTPFHVPRAPGERGVRLDVAGGALATLAMALLVFAVGGASDPTRASGVTAALLLGALSSALAFVLVEERVSRPLVPLASFRAPGLRSAMTVTAVVAAAAASTTLLLSLYLQGVLGHGPLVTGLAFLPAGIAGLVAGNFAPRLLGRISARKLIEWGLAALAVSLAVVSFIEPDSGAWLVRVGYLAAGMGIVTSLFAATVLGTMALGASDQGLAGGLLNTSHQVGAALGVALIGLLVTWRGAPDLATLTQTYRLGLALLALASILTATGLALRRTRMAAPMVAVPAPTPVSQADLGPRPVGALTRSGGKRRPGGARRRS